MSFADRQSPIDKLRWGYNRQPTVPQGAMTLVDEPLRSGPLGGIFYRGKQVQNPLTLLVLAKSRKMREAFLGGFCLSGVMSAAFFPLLAFQAGKAGTGGFVSTMVGGSATLAAGVPIAGFASAGLSLIPGIGPFAAAVAGTMLVGYGEYRVGKSLIKATRYFTDTAKRIRHLEMGGSYADSELAQRQRYFAIHDMNATMIPGRRYLGQEALLMHR